MVHRPAKARSCELYWAPITSLSSAHDGLLSATERIRRDGFRQHADRARFVLATALLRLAAGAWLRREPEELVVDRTCNHCLRSHGRPRILGSDLHASISHAGRFAAVALSDAAPVGVDVERTGRIPLGRLLKVVCEETEQRHVASDADLYSIWTRKESVLKATGVGLTLPMTRVKVTPPSAAPRIIDYDGEQKFPAQMFERLLDPDHPCCVTVLSDLPVAFHARGADPLLSYEGIGTRRSRI